MMYDSKTMKSSEVLNGFSWPASSILSISSSTQTQSTGSSGQYEGSNYPYGGIITENRISLAKGQYSQHLIRFVENGQIQVQVPQGVTLNLYSKKGTVWPDSNSFKTDYDQSMKVTSIQPIVMNTTPGVWIFTINAPQEEGEYYLAATHNEQSNQVSGQQTVTKSSEYSLQTTSMRDRFPLPNHTPGIWNYTSV